MPSSKSRLTLLRRILKISAWTIMGLVLFVAALVICLVKLLTTEQLTAIVSNVANEMLDARVDVARVQLDFADRKPFITLSIDSLTVVSGPMQRLSAAQREIVPEWADTVVAFDHFEGSLNPLALIFNEVSVRDVELSRPKINLYALSEDVANYNIYESEPDTTTVKTELSLPGISINHFKILNPYPIRYASALTGQEFTVMLKNVALGGEDAPTYSLDFGGDFHYALLEEYKLLPLTFGLDGKISWDPSEPYAVAFNNFEIDAAFLKAFIDADMNFGDDLVVSKYAMKLSPVQLSQLIEVLPDSMLRACDLMPSSFSSDIAMSLSARSTAPFNLATDSMPNVDVDLKIEPGQLNYGHAHFDKVSGLISASIKGNDISAAVVSVKDFKVKASATDIAINASATDIMGDPLVKGTVEGSTSLKNLPDIITAQLDGALSGHVTADLSFCLRPSMLSREKFHMLNVKGDIDADNLSYRASDESTSVYARHSCFTFGSNERKAGVDSLLTATIEVDTADVSYDNMAVHLSDLTLGVGASNKRKSADTTAITPMGGGLKLGRLRVRMPDEGIAVNVRGVSGRVGMQRYKGDSHRPLFTANLDIHSMSAGDSISRMMMRGAKLQASGYKLPRKPIPANIKHTADSLHRANPKLPMDSVYRYAVAQHRSLKGRNHHHDEFTSSETEIIDWGASKAMRRFLNEWDINGTISVKRAGLYTAYFPIRNRLSNFDLTFTTDSIALRDVDYEAGSSDFCVSGYISNIKRSFTSRGYSSPLKIKLDMQSDTIDVNEIANTVFKGSAYADSQSATAIADIDAENLTDDAAFENELNQVVANAPDTLAPLLIPTNIDMTLNMNAKNILYSDLLLHNFSGEMLAYRGALNLNNLHAASEVGSINLSALYSAPKADDIKFGFGMQVDKFNINRFMKLIPALDSIMPIMKDFAGIIDADIAATCNIDKSMDMDLSTLESAIKLSGDSLELIDPETYRTIGKWLLFKDKQDNIIKHMAVEIIVKDGTMQLYPFIFDIDRYKLGVQGHNDLAMNFDYHIAVLKSPIPFKFGINVKGNPDKYKIRLGRARLKENQAVNVAIVDTTRINLLNQIQNLFRRGVDNSRFASLNLANAPTLESLDAAADTISAADSAVFIREGLIAAPIQPATETTTNTKKSSKCKNKNKNAGTTALLTAPILPEEPTIKSA